MYILEKEGKSQRADQLIATTLSLQFVQWHVIFFRKSVATVMSVYRDGARSARSNLLYVRPRLRPQCFLIVGFPLTSRSLYSYRIAGYYLDSTEVVAAVSVVVKSSFTPLIAGRGQSDGANGTEGKGASGSRGVY
ncbi:hypothetical protein G5I_08291 [Acromyrmex echinatior]|uniref:Uncharacterized protein n=1 Tax=Acromyrmex echinatior TaxID=103372 RepID=F4WR36_ACREC|nr:hypothetical protein G5I_08291 [Acromyrmex echinatior]